MHKVWVAADIGQIVNLSGAENQCQGSVVDAFSTAMGLKITFANAIYAVTGRRIRTLPFSEEGYSI